MVVVWLCSSQNARRRCHVATESQVIYYQKRSGIWACLRPRKDRRPHQSPVFPVGHVLRHTQQMKRMSLPCCYQHHYPQGHDQNEGVNRSWMLFLPIQYSQHASKHINAYLAHFGYSSLYSNSLPFSKIRNMKRNGRGTFRSPQGLSSPTCVYSPNRTTYCCRNTIPWKLCFCFF
jgi:hypothetical protein